MFKEFIVGDILSVEQTKSVVAKYDLTEGNIPYVTRTVSGNGYSGTCGNSDRINAGNCITIGAETGVAFYQPDDFVAGNKVYRLSRNGLGEKEYLYLAGVLNKQTSNYSYSNARIPPKIKAEYISLPVIESPDPSHVYTADDIDWKYMQERIAELEQECIAELDAYLVASGLDDCELTDEDKKMLSLSPESASGEAGTLEADYGNGQASFKKFALGDVFNIYSPKKRFNANAVQFDGKYPYVARGSSNNGIRGYITEDEQYLSPAKSLSFGQDTATVFYQPDAYFTGDKIKVMVLNNHELNDELAQYFITVITKSFSIFAWGQNSFNEKILKATEIVLPVIESSDADHEYTIDDIDYDYMERYIRTIEKLVIAVVAEHKDKLIETTQRIVGV